MEQPLRARIRERAYDLWDANGRTDGHAEQHWLAAERELLAELTARPQIPQINNAQASPSSAPERVRRGARRLVRKRA